MNNFKKKLYSAFTAITDITAAKIRTAVSLINIISLRYITRFENIFNTIVSINLKLKTD